MLGKGKGGHSMTKIINIIDGKHANSDDCPTYYDGCHCWEHNILSMAEIASDAQLECGKAEDEVTRLRAIIEDLPCTLWSFDMMDCGKCPNCVAKQKAKEVK